ncbi:leucine-rich repeat domain-containing protein [Zooshikella harenae]|uniref:Leucine-rich repeat domain-containing protein n=1 Tax=Zooshikella harenae TaxID=2827238 RepID=A0ABS5Z725_9GAMM|nr:leucine-rich repeat domain-containing protein [Zooshikella harenae]MBU2709852.1 leucine-rich repeat domain-containing protein [Zooshikella harenae]
MRAIKFVLLILCFASSFALSVTDTVQKKIDEKVKILNDAIKTDVKPEVFIIGKDIKRKKAIKDDGFHKPSFQLIDVCSVCYIFESDGSVSTVYLRKAKEVDLQLVSKAGSIKHIIIMDAKINNFDSIEKIGDLVFVNLLETSFDSDSIVLSNKTIKYFTLMFTDIKKIKFGPLGQVKYINVSINKIERVDGFQNIGSVETLNLKDNRISDLSGLKPLKNLKKLSLYRNPIKDVSFLVNKPLLEELQIVLEAPKEQYQLFSELKNLKELLIQAPNNITDLSDLPEMPSLQALNIPGAAQHITDGSVGLGSMQGLKRFKNLEFLALSGHRYKKIEGLEHLPHLKELHINYTPIEDWSGLSKVSEKLEVLYAVDAKAPSVGRVEEIEKLRKKGVMVFD